jgi:hypothetical protein
MYAITAATMLSLATLSLATSRIPSTTTATITTSRIQASQDQDHRRSVADFHMRPDHLRRLHQRLRAMVWWLLQ